jgi:carboxyl-terminal processing protease
LIVYPWGRGTGLALTTAKYYTPSGRLIQRDYTGVSLYDYHTRGAEDNPSNNANMNLDHALQGSEAHRQRTHHVRRRRITPT